MGNAKENRRAKMTRMLLNESLLKFLAQKPLARITVKELCDDADINRSTYYAHFTDPYDQLKTLEANIVVDMSIYVESLMSEDVHDEQRQYWAFKSILDYILSKKHIFQVLMGKSGDYDLQRDILTFFGERLLPAEKYPDNDGYKFIFASTGSFGIIYDWIMHDAAVPTDELAKIITEFTSQFRSS